MFILYVCIFSLVFLLCYSVTCALLNDAVRIFLILKMENPDVQCLTASYQAFIVCVSDVIQVVIGMKYSCGLKCQAYLFLLYRHI